MACPREPAYLKASTDFLMWSERDAVRKAVFARDIPFCIWCQAPVGDHRSASYYQMDHVTPRSLGGPYDENNLVLSCKACNTARGNLSILQFLAARSPCGDIAA